VCLACAAAVVVVVVVVVVVLLLLLLLLVMRSLSVCHYNVHGNHSPLFVTWLLLTCRLLVAGESCRKEIKWSSKGQR